MAIIQRHIARGTVFIIRLGLLVPWVPIAVEKLWDPNGFRSALLRQPFPDWWADILFWLLPVLAAASLLLTPTVIYLAVNTVKKYGTEVISYLLMILFGLTALDKARQFERFYTELGKSPFLMAYQGWVAWGTPIVEGIVVVLLIYGGTLQLWGLYASVFLMSLFTGYIYLLLNYSYYTPCLCSAALESLTWEQHLAFNLLFLALAITATALSGRQRPTHDNNKP